MRRIVDDRWPVKYPPYMSPAARDLIMRLLERKPVKRIGMLQNRAKDIKQHEWFKVRNAASSCVLATAWCAAASTKHASRVTHVRCCAGGGEGGREGGNRLYRIAYS
jgi:hypothetical protein